MKGPWLRAGYPCIIIYCCRANDPNTAELKTTDISYLTVSVGQVSGHGLKLVPLAQGLSGSYSQAVGWGSSPLKAPLDMQDPLLSSLTCCGRAAEDSRPNPSQSGWQALVPQCGYIHRLPSVTTWQLVGGEAGERERTSPRQEPQSLCNLTLEVASHHFCRILLIRRD